MVSEDKRPESRHRKLVPAYPALYVLERQPQSPTNTKAWKRSTVFLTGRSRCLKPLHAYPQPDTFLRPGSPSSPPRCLRICISVTQPAPADAVCQSRRAPGLFYSVKKNYNLPRNPKVQLSPNCCLTRTIRRDCPTAIRGLPRVLYSSQSSNNSASLFSKPSGVQKPRICLTTSTTLHQ